MGNHIYSEARPYLQKILIASSEEEFDCHIDLLLSTFPSKVKVKELASELKSKRNNFAKYILDRTPCTFGRYGNQASEANHSSICAHIGTDYIMEIENILLRLIDRHRHICLKTNQELHKHYKTVLVTQDRLKNAGNVNDDLLLACKCLSNDEFIHYKK